MRGGRVCKGKQDLDSGSYLEKDGLLDPVLSTLYIFAQQISHSTVRERLSNLHKVPHLESGRAALPPRQAGSCLYCFNFTLAI